MATTIIGILRNRTFFTFESLNKAIYIEMNKLNNEEFQKREGSRKSVYMNEEKDFMNPLPEHPFELSEWKMATVQLNYHIQVEKMNYSIPYEYVGKRVEVKLTKDTVTVYYKKIKSANINAYIVIAISILPMRRICQRTTNCSSGIKNAL